MEIERTLVGAIDQGTSSSRFLLYQLHPRKIVASHQIEIRQQFPHPGWVEIDPDEITSTVTACIDQGCEKAKHAGFTIADIKAVGICNQRETTILWDCETGKALYNAIVWLDSRTTETVDTFIDKTCCKSKEHFKEVTGLPIHPYFSALKIRWLLDNVEKVKDAMKRGKLMFGTVDTWILYNLTGKHATDVTNASRTLLMSLKTLDWCPKLCNFFEIPMSILPKIHPSAEIYATISIGTLKGVPISGCLGDQQAAMFGEHCLMPGETKCTYGTGTFMLTNTGSKLVISRNGLLTTVAYWLGTKAPVCYALEGSGSIGGNAIQFLRDNLQIIKDVSEVEPAAASVPETDGVVFVPCFTGLYTPHWDSSARGTICGLVQTTTRAHIIRAALEAICFQTEEMVRSAEMDLSHEQKIMELKVDGGITVNGLFMQLLADNLGINVIKSTHTEASCWGAAMAAAIGAQIIRFVHEKFQDLKNFLGVSCVF
ncbi:unnamed protein product [Gongylonema pulchrum]|uniref:Probable glycerol kinase n=1 Tax=Gongylonema pulchrum TaxID=637853 RepID=A0A183CUA9_9BILA|nr:unnamed protein product [Gongylonema pulchrum]